jgi:hypothetical protein
MCIDPCGVDDHMVNDLELVIAGATVESQVGLILIIMNQCARMIDGKTTHSSGQMEHFKVTVNEKAFGITGGVPCIELIEGCRIHLSTINGRAHMKMSPFTKEEWDTLPHAHVTPEAPWDPKVLDHIPPIEWCKNQPQSLTLIEESLYNQHGVCKESTPRPTDKKERVLDAEKPINDLNCNTTKETLADTPIETSKSDMRVYPHNLIRD